MARQSELHAGPQADRGQSAQQPVHRQRALRLLGRLAGAAVVSAGKPDAVRATSGGGDQGYLALGSNPWYIAGTNNPNTPAVSSAPTVIQASPNYGNFLGENGADFVLFEADASASVGGSIDGLWGIAKGRFGTGVYGTINGNGIGLVCRAPVPTAAA